MRCLVLGGMGFIGRHLVAALQARGDDVVSLDLIAPTPDRPLSSGVTSLTGSLLSRHLLDQAMAGVDLCFHLAASPFAGVPGPGADADDVASARTVLNAACAAGIRRLVFASSGGAVYGPPRCLPIPENHPTEPISAYGLSKLAIETEIRKSREQTGLDSVVLRLANAYGEGQRPGMGQGAVATFLDRALRGEPLTIWGDGSAIRDYVHVEDVVAALLAAGDAQLGPECVINIGTGRGTRVDALIDRIEALVGRPVRREHLPGRPFDVSANVLDISLAARVLGWRPQITLEAGLTRLADQMRAASRPDQPTASAR